MTQEKSTQIQNLEAQPPIGIPTTDWKGVKRIMRFTFTQGPNNGPAGSTMELVRLPAGNVRILAAECLITHDLFGAGRELDIGLRAYSQPDGTAIPEDADALVNGINVAAAGTQFWTADPLGVALDQPDDSGLIRSKSGVSVFATVLNNTIPAGTKLTGYVTYVQD